MSHAFNSLQNFMKENEVYPVFEIPTIEHNENDHFHIPYEKFFINYTGTQEDRTTLSCFYEAKAEGNIVSYKYQLAMLSELDDMKMKQLYVARGGVLQQGNLVYPYAEPPYANEVLFRHWSLADIPGSPEHENLVNTMLNKMGSLLLSLSNFLNHKDYRLLESKPRKCKEIGKSSVRLSERPVVRIIKLDELKSIYRKDTKKTGDIMPPHPRRSHWRELKAARYGENIGKRILIPAISVNGWEWKNSKGVTYKIV